MAADSSNTSYTDSSSLRLSTPEPMVALPCGSRSTISTRCPIFAKPAARLTVVVVLPTPPFWLATQKIFVIRWTPSEAETAESRASLGNRQLDAEAEQKDTGH